MIVAPAGRFGWQNFGMGRGYDWRLGACLLRRCPGAGCQGRVDAAAANQYTLEKRQQKSVLAKQADHASQFFLSRNRGPAARIPVYCSFVEEKRPCSCKMTLQGVSPSSRDTKVNGFRFAVKRIALAGICSIREKDHGITASAACGLRYNRPQGVQFEDFLFWIGNSDAVDLAWLLCREGKDRAATWARGWIVSRT
jgi:hypothetical protein